MGRFRNLLLSALLSLPVSACAVAGALSRAIFQRSGAPPRDEIQRMKEREEVMLHSLPGSRVLVLPVGVLGREASYRVDAAEELASELRRAGVSGARAVERVYGLPYPRQPNEAWTYWKRFRALADSVERAPLAGADYVLLMDVFGGTDESGEVTGVGAIHVVTTTARGEMAYGRLRNSHHGIFKEMEPGTLAEACRLAVKDLTAAREALR